MAKRTETEISKGLIKIGFRPEELDDLVRICDAAAGFAEERGSKELEDKAETWKKNFKLIKKMKQNGKS